jgi:hypothetical protein
MKNVLAGFAKSVGESITSAATAASTAVDSSVVAVKDSAQKAGHTAMEFGKSAGEVIGNAATATSSFTAKAGDSISESTTKSLATVKQGATTAGEAASAGLKHAGDAVGVAADTAGNALGTLAILVGDLNGDGKVDFEDAKIAAAKVREVAGGAAAELAQLGKSALQSKIVQDAAAGALVGGVLASGIPFIGTLTGASVGAALGAYKSLGKK